jgi:hypothetical protein
MVVLPIRVKLANVAAVQCSHDTDAREHRRARRRDQDQGPPSRAAIPRSGAPDRRAGRDQAIGLR